ncbi:MAG: baseplate J/gp47 family protein [Hungatella sp.]|nr:baseplate J/gp47 family protein [Hungatella sp.]
MNDELQAIKDYPDISFIEHYTLDRLEEDMITWFKEKKKELTGNDVTLAAADDRRLLLKTGAYFIYQGYMYADNAGKMGLLKYSTGDYLENLGALKRVPRRTSMAATTTIRFSVSETRSTATGIPKGTRITAGDGVYFETEDYCEIESGQLYTEVRAVCTTKGKNGNGYDIGDIRTIVDPVAFVDRAENVTVPANGADIEQDDPSYRERIYLAPDSYSAAGSIPAYIYFVREFNPAITDIRITSPSDYVVYITYLLEKGIIPGEESIRAMQEYLSRDEIKPVCDKIEVAAPPQKSYDLEVTYYINKSEKNYAMEIQKKVEEAIEDYIIWQRSKIGRDINPDMLRYKAMRAGAKRVEITSPSFSVVDEGTVAALLKRAITYGGLEDD